MGLDMTRENVCIFCETWSECPSWCPVCNEGPLCTDCLKEHVETHGEDVVVCDICEQFEANSKSIKCSCGKNLCSKACVGVHSKECGKESA